MNREEHDFKNKLKEVFPLIGGMYLDKLVGAYKRGRNTKSKSKRKTLRFNTSLKDAKLIFLFTVSYIRHNMTDYDDRLKNGEDRYVIRKSLSVEMNEILLDWGYTGDFNL